MRKLIPCLVALVVVGLIAPLAAAQECPGGKDKPACDGCPGGTGCEGCPGDAGCEDCPKAACDKADLVALVDKLDKCAQGGCKESAATLAEMEKIAGVKDAAELKARIQTCQKAAGAGCQMSAGLLEKLQAQAPKAQPLSARVSKASEAKLQGLMKACRVTSTDKLVACIAALETSAAKGCGTSKARLTVLDAAFNGTPAPLSARAVLIADCAKKGCDKSENVLAELLSGCGCDTPEALPATLAKLEAGAAKGDDACAKKLATLAAKVPAGCGDASCCGGDDCCGGDGDCCPGGAKPAKDCGKPCDGCPGQAG